MAVAFKQRAYLGQASPTTETFQLVGVRHPDTGQYRCHLTALTPTQLSGEDVAQLYRARWSIELPFKELKRLYQLDVIRSRTALAPVLALAGVPDDPVWVVSFLMQEGPNPNLERGRLLTPGDRRPRQSRSGIFRLTDHGRRGAWDRRALSPAPWVLVKDSRSRASRDDVVPVGVSSRRMNEPEEQTESLRFSLRRAGSQWLLFRSKWTGGFWCD